MPIRYLENYLHEQGRTQSLALSVLSETRLGIDAAYYIQQLLDSSNSKEPLLAAIGGLPLTLAQRIEADLHVLENLNVKPVFVFPGLLPNGRRDSDICYEERKARLDREYAWTKYEAGQEEVATTLFKGRHGLRLWDLWWMILRIFKSQKVEFIIAPYLAWAQLIYLQCHPKSYIHAIYGPTETLLYPGVDKLITSLDLGISSPTFQYVSKCSLIQELGVNDEQFLDVGILLGFDQSPPFPPFAHAQALKATVDMVTYYKSGHAIVSAFSEHPTVRSVQYSDYFARTRSLIKFSLVLTSDGVVQPLPLSISNPGPDTFSGHHDLQHLNNADIPIDLHEIFTHRLPDEVYYYLSRGLIGPQALVWLTTGQIVENPPLDNGETTEYKRFVKEVITDGQTTPRTTALALISNVLHSFWSRKRVLTYFWFDPPTTHPRMNPFHSPQTGQLAERAMGWNVPYPVVEYELRRQNSSTVDFALCLGATYSEKCAQRTKMRGILCFENKDEIVANIIWRFLGLRGFLLRTHTHSPFARAMYDSLRQARVTDNFQEPLYLFLELLRAGVIHGHLWAGRAFSGGPTFGSDDEKPCMLLVIRVLSIVPLNFVPIPWSAPLSRELLVFNSFLRSFTRALRAHLEATTLNMLLQSDTRNPRVDLLDISLSLPFQTETNIGFGVLAKVYLDSLTRLNHEERVRNPNAEGVKEAKEVTLEICEKIFSCVKNPKLEVERGFRFWDIALTAARRLHSEGQLLAEVNNQFEAADAWLAPMRPGVIPE